MTGCRDPRGLDPAGGVRKTMPAPAAIDCALRPPSGQLRHLSCQLSGITAGRRVRRGGFPERGQFPHRLRRPSDRAVPTVRDYENYVARLRAFPRWVDE
jgi:hypothetical protein